MTQDHNPIRGFNDILIHDAQRWRSLENILIEKVQQSAYHEIRLPILERTDLFCRSVGMNTDIVGKEMYTFTDRNDESVSLRPEATASCMRALYNAGLLHHQSQKVWYCGPMFRRERPQKGRLRQFHQFGVECIGASSPLGEIELLSLCQNIWDALPLMKPLSLELNYLASVQTRRDYTSVLKTFLRDNISKLDEDSIRRVDTNPLRVFDSKIASTQALLASAPLLSQFYTTQEVDDFSIIQEHLNHLNIPFVVQPGLVRGLDYYNGLVYEWTTTELGAQGTVCAGGRYNGLAEQLGFKSIEASGFSIGLERLLLLCEYAKHQSPQQIHIFIIPMTPSVRDPAFLLMQQLRQQTDAIIELCATSGSLKSMMKKADKSNADFVCVIGEDEIRNQQFQLKSLRTKSSPLCLSVEELIKHINKENTYETK